MKSLLTSASLATLASAVAAPRTLLEYAGAQIVPARLSTATLVVIDAQCEYTTGKLPLAEMPAALAEAGELLARARQAGTPIVHVVHLSRPGAALFDPNGEGSKSIPGFAPKTGEVVVSKSLPNAFARTDLDEQLQRIGRKELIVNGFMTHNCVSATVRSALDHGYTCTVVAGACADRDLAGTNATVIPAATVQEAELAALRDRFAVVVLHASDLRD